jgi:two-component system alkaline phosphatase synthesis response regulator PhoP
MASNGTLLCIHRDPAQLGPLREHGYELVTAANGHEGLRLFMSRRVDAIVLEYHLGLLDGATIANEIKQVRPETPVVMLANHADLPGGALKSVDAVVATSEGLQSLLRTVREVMKVRSEPGGEGKQRQAGTSKSVTKEGDTLFSPRVWRNIRNGTVRI